MRANLVNVIAKVLTIAVVIAAVEWVAFGFRFVIQYLYLSIGILVAVMSVVQTFKVLRNPGDTLQAQMMNIILLRQAFSSIIGALRLGLSVFKEAALRLTYWPLEFGLLAFTEKLNRAPNLVSRTAVAMEFLPRLPVNTAGWMLLVNLALLGFWSFVHPTPGGAFELYLAICMFVTIVWFFDFLVNPIEVQLRQSGKSRDAILRFATITVLSLFAIVILIYTYRLTETTSVSLVAVISDVIFGGYYDPALRAIKEAIANSLSNSDIKSVFTEVTKIDRGLAFSMTICFLFYSTIITRLWPALVGRSLFLRTEEESANAAKNSLLLGDIAAAREYANELRGDHSVIRSLVFGRLSVSNNLTVHSAWSRNS